MKDRKEGAVGTEMTTEELQTLLACCPSVKADLNLIVTSLRRRKLSGSHQCAKATIEILRNLVGRYNFSNAEQMMRVVKAVGRELTGAACSELCIGNLVRRVLFLVREEYANQVKEHGGLPISVPSKRDRSSSNMGVTPDTPTSLPEPPSSSTSAPPSAPSAPSAPSSPPREAQRREEQMEQREEAGAVDVLLGTLSLQAPGAPHSENFSRYFPGLKAGVISAINELNNEIDNMTVVCQRAQDHVHSDECILTYGYSKVVEQFLKAAGAKRKFQLIIAESSPELDGHKLAQSLSKTPSISVTLVPDSNVYALMSRVNKVILSPQAVMADGGAISPSGQLMVCIAAREFSVPVVCVAGAFTLTPLFAHNQSQVLNQLLSPASALPYHANINVGNVEVNYPAFDYVPPSLIALYVTNDGNQLPSYVFRQLSEYYHPSDYYSL